MTTGLRVASARPRFAGFVQLTYRDADDGERPGLRWPRLTCPGADHDLTIDSPIAEDGLVQCEHRAHAGAPQCGTRLWVLLLPRRERELPPLLYVAEIDWREVVHMEQERMTVPQILGFIGAMYAPMRSAPQPVQRYATRR